MKTVLAIDLGASSGRGILFTLKEGKLQATEVHRFPNGAKEKGGSLYWDTEYLFQEIKTALKKGGEIARIDGVGIDTWGVDYGFLNEEGKLLYPVHTYRDVRTTGAVQKCEIPPEDLYAVGGIAPNEINTVYQLWTEKRAKRASDERLLMMPQLLGAMLCGRFATEPTIASTTGFFRKEKGFDAEVAKKIGVDASIFPQVKPTGSILGEIQEEILKEAGIDYPVPVILCPGHDTACAVLSIPTEEEEPLFLSSGTWSLFGTERKEPILTLDAMREGYSNELGYGNTVRFLKNIMGLWVLQECRRQWAEAGAFYDFSYAELAYMAEQEPSRSAYIDIGSKEFTAPNDMADRVYDFVFRTQQIPLDTMGEVVRCILESLAMEYRYAYDGLKKLTGKTYTCIHIIGGGSQNKLLNQMTANALKIPVSAGPSEGTAMGNAIAQLIALGEIQDVKEARRIVANTCSPEWFYPQEDEFTEENYKKYLSLKK